MALMLRKDCQQTLNDIGLAPYHADINTNTKKLNLYTTCGKYLAEVAGVTFSTLNPTKAEIAFAVDLLDEWLTKHKSMFVSYLKELEVHRKMGNQIEDTATIAIKTTQRFRVFNNTINMPRCIVCTQSKVEYAFDLDGNLNNISWEGSKPPSTAFQITPENLKRTLAHLKSYMNWVAQENKVAELLEAINTCNG